MIASLAVLCCSTLLDTILHMPAAYYVNYIVEIAAEEQVRELHSGRLS